MYTVTPDTRPSAANEHAPRTSGAQTSRTIPPQSQQRSLSSLAQQRGHKKNWSVTSNPQPAQNNAVEADPSTFDSHYMPSQRLDADVMSTPYHFDSYSGDGANHEISFDELLTPEYSENQLSEHTTPQELIWEQQFLSQDTVQPHIIDNSHQAVFGATHDRISPFNDLQGLVPTIERQNPKFVAGSQLLSPQLSSHSPLEPASRPTTSVQTGSASPSPAMGQSRKRGAEPLDVSTSQSTLSPQAKNTTQPRAQSPTPRSVSPVVIVSSHNRGDSPARTAFPHPRMSGKRGHQSDLQHGLTASDEESPPRSPKQISNNDATTRLMPPDPFGPETFDDNSGDRAGLGPSQRGSEQVTSINELEEQRQIEEKNVEVENWLATSETGSTTGDTVSRRGSRRGHRGNDRPRAHSTGVHHNALGLPAFSDKGIPGPGILLDEDSEDEYTDDGSDTGSGSSENAPESPPVSQATMQGNDTEQSYFPALGDDEVPPELQEPLPRQFYRRAPWQDPVRGQIVESSSENTRDQPPSSNAAAARWNQEAARWETASRAATWGTRRRLSESEINSIVEGSRVRHLSLAKRGRERGNSILNKARSLIPHRSNSNIKKATESPASDSSPEREPLSHRESASSNKPVQRKPSIGKPKSPPLNTGSAFMAMTSQLTAVGQSTPLKTEPDSARSPLNMLRKYRSKSDVGKPPAKPAPGLAELMTSHGGPPMPTLASPLHERQPMVVNQHDTDDAGADDDDEEDLMDEVGVKMEFKAHADSIIPTYEGFKIHVRQLNPRLEPFLIERVGQEQIRRYKKLIENKVKHTRAVRVAQRCPSGGFCLDLGGKSVLLPPRVSAKDPDATCAQFQVPNTGDDDPDESSFTEGVVTPALFPPGIPLPPVKRLPAEFECPLCFKVKKFQKPSDWTKHVHEDVQPFSCTFPNCNEPKSFKRKADWVRHENERHRRLEFWKCNVQECNHICYRKDNFVQHLVREHKKVEPKNKSRGSGSSKAKPPSGNAWQMSTREQADNEVWRLVDLCRHETSSKPRDEPCKFCGNFFNSWKKLSVHMGKHMEFIAMPVLDLVKMKEVKPDTVVSPVEQAYQQQPPVMSVNGMVGGVDHSLSPYAMSAPSAYQSSSAGQSPATMQVHPQMGQGAYNQAYYSSQEMSAAMQGQVMHSDTFGTRSGYPPSSGYATNDMSVPQQFMSINTQLGGTYPSTHLAGTPTHQMQTAIPRSLPFDVGYDMNQMSRTAYHQPRPTMAYSASAEASPYPQYASPMQQDQQQHHLSNTMDQMQQMEIAPDSMDHDYIYDAQHSAHGASNYQFS